MRGPMAACCCAGDQASQTLQPITERNTWHVAVVQQTSPHVLHQHQHQHQQHALHARSLLLPVQTRLLNLLAWAGFEVDDAMEVLCHALPLDGLQILADQLGQEDASHDDLRAIIQVQACV